METWLIILIAVLGLLVLCFGLSYLFFVIAFKRGRDSGTAAYLEKVRASYFSYSPIAEGIISSLGGRPFEKIELESFEGQRLSARYYSGAAAAPIHILFHGYRSAAQYDMAAMAEEFIALGHSVILADQRAHGESSGKVISFGIKEKYDVLEFARYAEERFPGAPIFISGVSMGAATVLMSLDLDLPGAVRGVIADCPYSSPEKIIARVSKRLFVPAFISIPLLRFGARLFGGFKLRESSALLAVSSAKVPVLLLHGEGDRFVPCDMSREIAEAAASSGSSLEFYSFPEARHAASYYSDAERYRKIIFDFIKNNA